jgi:hypothetical protein
MKMDTKTDMDKGMDMDMGTDMGMDMDMSTDMDTDTDAVMTIQIFGDMTLVQSLIQYPTQPSIGGSNINNIMLSQIIFVHHG